MTNQKIQLTKTFLEQLGIETTAKNITDWHYLWWQNPRKNKNYGFRLTERGLEDFESKLKLKSYKITYPTPLNSLSSQFILRLDKFIDCPFYLDYKYIKVFKERVAIELVLFDGNLPKYLESKHLSQKNNK